MSIGVLLSPLNPNKEHTTSGAILQMASGVSSKIGASGGPENGGTFRKEEALSAAAIS